MAKIFTTEGTGASQVLNEADNNKLKVYDSYDDIDTTDLVDGEVVSTKEVAGNGSNVYDYIQQLVLERSTADNLLSDREAIAVGTYTMDYDGFIQAYMPYATSGSGRNMSININGTAVLNNNYGGSGSAAYSSLVPVRKGDVVVLSKEGSGNGFYAWFYKQRYYGGRN